MSDSYEDNSDDDNYNDNMLEYPTDYSELLDISKDIVDRLRYYVFSNGLDMLTSVNSASNLVHLCKF